jgi:integrase/recombinase XerC
VSQSRNQADINGYLQYLQTQRKLANHTLSNYRLDLQQLEALASAEPSIGLASLSHFDIRRFASQLHAKNLSSSSIARKLSAWRGFFDWLADHQLLANNPATGVKPPKRPKPLPKALGVDDAVRLVTGKLPDQDENSASQLCNHAMFELLYSSGLRVSELTGLDLRYVQQPDYASSGWIDFDAGEVIVTGKGNKRRSVPVGAAAMHAVSTWIATRTTLPVSALQTDVFALFLTARGRRMTPRVVQTRIKAHAQALGIPSDVHPHVLRHSFASHVLQSSGDLRAVQEMLGHASIASTQIYTSLDFQRLAQVYDAAHPRAKKQKTPG